MGIIWLNYLIVSKEEIPVDKFAFLFKDIDAIITEIQYMNGNVIISNEIKSVNTLIDNREEFNKEIYCLSMFKDLYYLSVQKINNLENEILKLEKEKELLRNSLLFD